MRRVPCVRPTEASRASTPYKAASKAVSDGGIEDRFVRLTVYIVVAEREAAMSAATCKRPACAGPAFEAYRWDVQMGKN